MIDLTGTWTFVRASIALLLTSARKPTRSDAVHRLFIEPALKKPLGSGARMSEPSRVDYQVKHYRELAQIALDCARQSTAHRLQYLDLAKQWSALAAQLESGEKEPAGVTSNRVKLVL